MKPNHISIAILLMSPFLVSSVWAQAPASGNQSAAAPAPTAGTGEVPRLIKFSGVLLDAQGRPQYGPVGVAFALYAQQNDGAALWLETQNVKPDENGNYTVLLGANSAQGVPAELFVSGEARWLGIQVGQQPEHDRILLVSVPYALKAGDAETLGGKPLSSFVLNEASATGSSAGFAPVAPSSAAGRMQTATGAGGKTSATPQAVTPCSSVTSDGTATANSIALFTTPCNVQSSLMTQASINGFPGVNVAGNNAGLLLNGTGTHQVTVTGATSGRLGQDANGFFFASDTNGKSVRFLASNGTLNEWMRITSAGNIGIGTQTPAAKLEVNGTTKFDGAASVNLASAAPGQTMLSAVAGGLSEMLVDSSGTLTLNGSLNLGATINSKIGVINLGGVPFAHSFGSTAFLNTFLGANAGNFTMSGTLNTATGYTALSANTSGTNNTASGALALLNNTTGSGNTASGRDALQKNASGNNNTAIGLGSLFSNSIGSSNTAVGHNALQANNTTSGNTAMGESALFANTADNNSAFGANALTANTTGFQNAAFGFSALFSNTINGSNSAFGQGALSSNNDPTNANNASNNSAFGASALNANTTGSNNSAFGAAALLLNTSGFRNAAFGPSTLRLNTTGTNNDAFGADALFSNTTGFNNSAFGDGALTANTTGANNSAFGDSALNSNTMGFDNSAFGVFALQKNTTGLHNSAFGENALLFSTTGLFNSAFGFHALQNLTSGDSNIAIGSTAGLSLTTGSSNIYVGADSGASSESNAIRIGTTGTQAAAFIAGINGATSASGTAVFVNAAGQLGTTTSSRRFKDDIVDMAGESDLLMKLRPVVFYYKPELDSTHTRQYGLVAEEVAVVAPELVVFDKDGQPQTVRYHFVNAMLLNEVQKQQRTIQLQQAEIEDLTTRLAKLEALTAPKP